MKKVLLILLVIAVILPLVQISFGWFTSGNSASEDRLTASSLANYFHAGNGISENPYIITTPRHLYNLIWLQNVKYFGTRKCYFKIGDTDHPITELDMAGAFPDSNGNTGALPPIGSVDNPFVGNFNGNGCVIKNLWISSDPQDRTRLVRQN